MSKQSKKETEQSDDECDEDQSGDDSDSNGGNDADENQLQQRDDSQDMGKGGKDPSKRKYSRKDNWPIKLNISIRMDKLR
jgi:hypothetical protein